MGKKILLIDDVESILSVFSFSLKQAGYEVHTANNCTDGFNLALEITPDIIIIDNKMPTGMSGWDTTKRIRSHTKIGNIPIIGFTAYTGKTEIDSGLKAGLNEIILKPVYVDELLRVIKKYID